MSKPLKPRRGTTAEHAAFIGQAHEVTYDTDKQTLVCHDGLTAGGFPLARADEVAAKDAAQDEAIAGKLDKSGGTLTGSIILDTNLLARRSVDNEVIVIRGGSDGTSASIQISGKNHSLPGWIALIANDGTNTNNFTVQPSGRGTLNGHDILTSAGGYPIATGMIVPYAANATPSGGFLLCNGAAVSRTTYAALFSAIGTLYGEGDGSTTFNLPNLTDKFIQGSGTAGTVKAAGLPNITGSVGSSRLGAFWGVNGSGALYTSEGDGSCADYRSDVNYINIHLDASRSSSIYGASTTVQPPALTMRYYIKY